MMEKERNKFRSKSGMIPTRFKKSSRSVDCDDAQATMFKAKPARKIVRARPVKAAKDAV